MTPLEVASKFAGASANCRQGICPFAPSCRNGKNECQLKEIAMMIRSLVAELDTMHAKYNALDAIAKEALKYMNSLEQINERYYRLAVAFQNGYRTKSKVKRKVKRKPPKKKDPIEMDGDPRYEYVEPKPPELPVVII